MIKDKYDFNETIDNVILQLISGCKEGKSTVSSRDIQLSDELEEQLPSILTTLKDNGLVESFEYFFPGAWDVKVTDLLKNYFSDEAETSESEKASASDSEEENADPKAMSIKKLLDELWKYDIILEAEFGPAAAYIRSIRNELSDMLSKEMDPDIINAALAALRDFSLEQGSGLIAQGIYAMVHKLL